MHQVAQPGQFLVGTNTINNLVGRHLVSIDTFRFWQQLNTDFLNHCLNLGASRYLCSLLEDGVFQWT